MRTILLAAAAALAMGPASAQTSPAPSAADRRAEQGQHPTGERPVDNGPTPGSDSAYQGGGVILQGAPGAPAPTPQPTPPGQTPQGAVQR
jgi:hypothetical protein